LIFVVHLHRLPLMYYENETHTRCKDMPQRFSDAVKIVWPGRLIA